MNGKTYQIHGCMVEMSASRRAATVRRPELKDDKGKVIQSAAEAEFDTKVEGEGDDAVSISAQEQAHLWARELPAIVDASKVKRAKGK